MASRPLTSHRSQLLLERARSLRSAPTLSELKLWHALRGSRIGVAFRRQVVVGEHIVDFLAPSCRLIVEVDGGYHSRRPRADARRDAALVRLGFRVLRLSEEIVLHQVDEAVALVERALLQ